MVFKVILKLCQLIFLIHSLNDFFKRFRQHFRIQFAKIKLPTLPML